MESLPIGSLMADGWRAAQCRVKRALMSDSSKDESRGDGGECCLKVELLGLMLQRNLSGTATTGHLHSESIKTHAHTLAFSICLAFAFEERIDERTSSSVWPFTAADNFAFILAYTTHPRSLDRTANYMYNCSTCQTKCSGQRTS